MEREAQKAPLRTSPAPENPVSEPEAEAAGALAGPLGQLVAMLEEEGEALVEHLEELRIRLLIFAGAFLAAAWVGWLAAPRVLAGFQQAVGRLIFVAPAEAFMTRLRIAGALGLLLSLPVGIYQAWRFVAPALFPEEKRLARLFVWASSLLFAGGLAFGYWVVYPVSLSFFLRLGTEGLRPAVVVSQHLSFFLGTTLSFGIAFQLPAALLLLVRAGVLTAERLKEVRRPALFACVVAAAALTPADVVSLAMMAVPLVCLYEAAVFLAPRFERESSSA